MGIEDPSSYKPCKNCRRQVFEVPVSPGKTLVIDSELARIAGVSCGKCGGFFCVLPCSLRGSEPPVRLCPSCRGFLVGILDA